MTKARGTPQWRSFELAVAQFAAAMDPNAKVHHNFFTSDADSKRPRQRDVWIEAVLCGLWPVNVHVSCKRYKRKLHEGDIDTFVGELASSGAHKGVLYSYRGFGAPAIEKARACGICCCQLYENEPADLPGTLQFDAYCCSSQVMLAIDPSPPPRHLQLQYWNDLFQVVLRHEDMELTLLDAICQAFQSAELAAVAEMRRVGGFPQPLAFQLSLRDHEKYKGLTIIVHGRWKTYRGKLDAFLLNGSYSFTSNAYAGTISTPPVDMLSSDPGPGWQLLELPPAKLDKAVLTVRYDGDAKATLLEAMGSLPIAP
jgi:hypothetical protein